jgi:hypothetical protein
MKIGYVRVEAFEPFDLFNEWRVVPKAHIPDLVRETELKARIRISKVAQSLMDKASVLEPFVDELVVSVETSRELAWEAFIVDVAEGSKVLVEAFDQLSHFPAKQLEYIKSAKERGILVLPMDQKELIDLSIDAAYSLLSKYSLSAMETQHNPRSEEASYERMLTLMKQGKSVVDIIEETGWSRSTLFRLRRQYKERLATDLPTFKKRYE